LLSPADKSTRAAKGLVGSVRHELERGRQAVGVGRQRQVLQGTAERDVHLAPQRVYRPNVAAGDGVEVDAVGAQTEEPGLRVVGTGRQDGRPDQCERHAAGLETPLPPGIVSGPLAGAEDALVIGTVERAAD